MKRLFLSLLTMATIAFMGCQNGNDGEKEYFPPRLELSKSELNILFDHSNYTIGVSSSSEWSAESDSEWISLTTLSGKAGSTALQFSVAQNDSDSPRNGKVTVVNAADKLSAELVITQGVYSESFYKITYTTSDNTILEFSEEVNFGVAIKSHTYGVIEFEDIVRQVGE